MKATVNLDDWLYRRVKIKAAEDGVTVTSIFEVALQRYLDAKAAESEPTRSHFEIPVLKGTGGVLPGIDLSNNQQLQELLDMDTPGESPL